MHPFIFAWQWKMPQTKRRLFSILHATKLSPRFFDKTEIQSSLRYKIIYLILSATYILPYTKQKVKRFISPVSVYEIYFWNKLP